MNNLIQYLELKNQNRKIFKERALNLENLQDREFIAESLSCDLSPENLYCDGELSPKSARKKYVFLTKVANELLKKYPSLIVEC